MVTCASGMRSLISLSMSLARIGIETSRGSGGGARHEAWQPRFEALTQFCDENGALALERQCVPGGEAELPHGNAGGTRALHDALGSCRADCHDVARLVLAEPEGMRRERRPIKLSADSR